MTLSKKAIALKQFKHVSDSKTGCIIIIQSEIRKAMGDFLRSEGFIEISPVVISPITDPLCHNMGKAEIEYNGVKYQLTKSMIFHKQMAVIAQDKIFTFSPNIRFEPVELANTGRHLIEFSQLDMEIKNASRDELIDIGERLLVSVLEYVTTSCKLELEMLDRELSIPSRPFEIIKHEHARKEYGDDFEVVMSRTHKEPFWIIDIPIEEREFYDREYDMKKGLLKDMDLIYPEGYGEALSGGEREHEYSRIISRMKRSGLTGHNFEWYIEFAKLGIPPSGGFGIGIERLTRFICGLKNINEATLFPKIPGEISF